MTVVASAVTVDVVFAGVDQVFSYRVPEFLAGRAAAGMRVLAPFGRRRLTGTIAEVREGADPRATRAIEFLLDERAAFSSAILKFTRWIADYYLCPWGDVLKAALPAGISLDDKRCWTLVASLDDARIVRAIEREPRLVQLFEALRSGSISAEQMRRQFGWARTAKILKDLEAEGILSYQPVMRPPRLREKREVVVTLAEEMRREYGPDLFTHLRSVHEQQIIREVFESGPDGILRSDLLKGASSGRRQAFAKLAAAKKLDLRQETLSRWDPHAEAVPETIEPERLTDEQQSAVGEIRQSMDRGKFSPYLLFGITGSGKTQVYIEAIRHALTAGKTALVLLPEIALTPYVWGRFYRAFGDRVAIQHSAQSPAVRFDLWRDIRNGRYPVVVGARSAVFAPLDRLGIIVVDEEQEPSYKQDDPAPRYHARDAALVRAQTEGTAIILGSATPSVESLQHALTGRYKMLRLTHRPGGSALPEIRIVQRVPPPPIAETAAEQKQQDRQKKPRFEELPLFTEELLAQIGETLERKKQIILLQNRRGFSPFLICAECGRIPSCPNCSVSLTYHRRGVALRCHYCDHREAAPDACPRCACPEWLTQGYGTQRLEELLAEQFPAARILRMDSDTVTRRGMHGRMVAAFAAGDYDILVGTQMIAKGLDFPDVELSAVMQADTELFYPDFRASERAASLITQVAGRAGRRTDPGLVLIQSSITKHPVLEHILSGDWQQFIEEELNNRKRSGFPPAARLILLRSKGKNESAAVRALLRMRRLLQKDKRITTLGPAPAVISRMKGDYRFNLLVRTLRENDPAGGRLRDAARRALDEYKTGRAEPGVTIDLDVDPQTVT